MAPLMKPFLPLLAAALGAAAIPYNTFDGPGFPACNDVASVINATSVAQIESLVAEAAAAGTPVRASGKGHMWYDTMCADNSSSTLVIRTEYVNGISDFDLPEGAETGTVLIEAGVTFFQLAEYLHQRGASVGYTLVNWNITLAGSVAMGAHRSSLREDSMVAAGVEELHIVDGSGKTRVVARDEGSDEWLAASTSLGLLGVIVRMKMKIYPDFKVYAQQETLLEEDVLDGDIYGLISPYATANFWWWPFLRKFHYRYYDPVPANTSDQEGFQSTFSVTKLEADTAAALLNSGKYLASSNIAAETLFFSLWSPPNFREKTTDKAILTWPVYGWNYDVLIGGLYPGYGTEWDFGLRGLTMELAFPVTQANAVLKRVRKAFDDEAAKGIIMTSTYRSGINIKFGKAYFDLLGQVTYDTADGADWSKGAIMFDFPSFKPTVGDGLRFNEPFYHKLATTLIDEFPCRPHWTKNTRDVFKQAVKNIDPDHLARFKKVREDFDPNGIFKSVVGEIIGVS
ncbi:putative fad fmn-containing dehydrogenase protein [Lasiodiplodia theobromae]|uniref:D-arabinono-1,4-lactone oxidase n=2 Tax=Lasiodiplodia TaxID=66739 RepID=A0A5N5DPR1_9PEZI|nr:Fad/Fmn-containing dehydrogenase [Lasiodiplodia theobromae]KAB2579938.1 putative L-gulonolactone oxidase 6 [Lasiodiplodia theobromae]KAF4540892.1 Fad/Fmn-containing dehydrogenase [Lasiodiplodia theobromae]KAF9634624.1 putative fad fmn-containing dehydrogenase protein [Lasiodiplodia theobromae]KAK0660257.1 putative L-gulonolactone oxidase 6 [Lasiodiplodia hormozganensis]